MKFRWIFVILCAMLMTGVFAHAEQKNKIQIEARDELREMGFEISDDVFEAVCGQVKEIQAFAEEHLDAPDLAKTYERREYFVYTLLMNEGIGEYDYDTMTWTPTSDKIYVTDGEVFNVEKMYTEFLQGVQAIVTDAVFSEISEDLSGMTDEWDEETWSDGVRSVSFLCNGHPYQIELISYMDWLNLDIIDFVNDALKEEGCSGRLHSVGDEMDQMLFLIYGSEEEADALRKLMGTESITGRAPTLFEWAIRLMEMLF